MLFELSTNVPFVFLVVRSDFALSLLEDLYFETTFAGPLLAKILVQFLNRAVLKFSHLLIYLLLVELLLSHDPCKSLAQTLFKDFHDAVECYYQIVCHRWVTFGVTWWLHFCFLQVVVWFERRTAELR